MFIIHELLSNVLDSQALLDSPRPTSPPSIPPKLPSSTSMNSPSLQQLKNEFNELTTMLKEQLGFSDQSAVMKKCSSIELLLNEIVESPKPSPVPAKSPLANNTVTIKRKSTLSNATPSIPPKPQSVKEKTFTPPPPFIQDSRNFQSSPELQRAAAVSVSEPNQVITPYKPPQKSESSENLFDKKTPFKPASEFGNMSSPSSRKKRSKTTKGKKINNLLLLQYVLYQEVTNSFIVFSFLFQIQWIYLLLEKLVKEENQVSFFLCELKKKYLLPLLLKEAN